MRLIRRFGAAISTLFIGLLIGFTVTVHAAEIMGTQDDDTIIGTNDPDDIIGLAGNDRISGLDDGDVIVGSNGRDTLIGGHGRDIMHGPRGHDTMYADEETTLPVETAEQDHIWGGPDDDTIYAQDGHRDHIDCGDGFDTAFVDAVDLVFGCENQISGGGD